MLAAFLTAPDQRAEATAIIDEAKAINAERVAGRFDGLSARADVLLARARALAHNPTLTRALAVRWRVAATAGKLDLAQVFMREVTEVAARSGNDDEAAKTWALMARFAASFQGQPDEGKVMIAAARSAAARAGDPPLLLAEVLSNEADVLIAAGDDAGARRAVTAARKLLEGAGAADPGSPDAIQLGGLQQTEGEAAWQAGDLDGAVAALQGAIATFDRALGPGTTDVGGVYLSLAQVYAAQDELDAALGAVEHALRIREATTPDGSPVAHALGVRASILGKVGRGAQAIADAERAQAIGARTLAPDDPQQRVIESQLAGAYQDAGRSADALAIYQRILASAERADAVTTNLAIWWVSRADVERGLGRCRDARPHYRRAIEIGRQLGSAGATQIARAEAGLAACK